MSYSSAIVIEELDSNQKPLRVLELRGPGLPKQGANWGGESVVPTTWLPGNPDDATQQVLVSKEIPTRWEGMWHLTMLNRTPCRLRDPSGLAGISPQEAQDVTSPKLLVDTIEDMRRKGRLIRVTWAVNSSDLDAQSISRLGRMTRADFKYKRHVDIDWEIEWTWKSRGTTQTRVTSTRDDNVPSAATAVQAAIAAAVTAANSKILSVNSEIRASASQFTLGQLEVFADAPRAFVQILLGNLSRFVNRFDEVGRLLIQVKSIPLQIANEAVQFARNTVDVGNQFVDDISGVPAEQTTLSNNTTDLLRSFCYFAHIDDATQTVNRRAAEMQMQLRQTLSTNPGRGAPSIRETSATQARDIITIRVVKKGDTPQSLSMLFYGTPDRDVDILRANRLPLYQPSFDAGSLVVIPVVSTSKKI